MAKTIRYIAVLMAACSFIAIGTAARAQSPEQFDLDCTGTKYDRSKNEKPWSLHLSVDLTAGQFCFAGCKAARNITRVEPDTIVFIDQITNQGMDQAKLTVSRSDGAIFQLMVSRMLGTIDTYRGNCILAPFTPLPKVLF